MARLTNANGYGTLTAKANLGYHSFAIKANKVLGRHKTEAVIRRGDLRADVWVTGVPLGAVPGRPGSMRHTELRCRTFV